MAESDHAGALLARVGRLNDHLLPRHLGRKQTRYGRPARLSRLSGRGWPKLAGVENKADMAGQASAAIEADRPRLAEARGSLRRDLALNEASRAPAGRRLSQLAFDMAPHHASNHNPNPNRNPNRLDMGRYHARRHADHEWLRLRRRHRCRHSHGLRRLWRDLVRVRVRVRVRTYGLRWLWCDLRGRRERRGVRVRARVRVRVRVGVWGWVRIGVGLELDWSRPAACRVHPGKG